MDLVLPTSRDDRAEKMLKTTKCCVAKSYRLMALTLMRSWSGPRVRTVARSTTQRQMKSIVVMSFRCFLMKKRSPKLLAKMPSTVKTKLKTKRSAWK